MVNRDDQKRNLNSLVKNGGFQFSETFFPYTSGEIGPYYVQSAAVMKTQSSYKFAVNSMEMLMGTTLRSEKLDYCIIAGGESRDWMFSMPLAIGLSKPHTMVYKNGKMLGADVKNKNVVWVADLNNEGSSPRDLWVPAIKNAGGNMKHIFFYVDRMEDGTQVMKGLGLKSYSVVPLDEQAWDHLREDGTVSEATYQNLRQRMENKDAWAREMLRSDAGFATLKKLHDDNDTQMKALKIADTYHELRYELLDRLGAI